jgi:beta-galactosidase
MTSDVAIFAAEVQDADGRIVPVPDNQINFRVTSAGKLIGTGNGDATNHEPDAGVVISRAVALSIYQSRPHA